MIVYEKSPQSQKNKYMFSEIKVGQCHILNDTTYTTSDLRRALSASYQYRKYYGLLDTVKFSIHLVDNSLKIYRIK